MNVNEQRASFFRRARRQRYAWAKRVDPTSVALFEQRTEQKRKQRHG